MLRLPYINEFDYDYDSLKFAKASQFPKFSLRTIKQISPSRSGLILNESNQISLSFLMIENPFIFVNTETLC